MWYTIRERMAPNLQIITGVFIIIIIINFLNYVNFLVLELNIYI